MISESRKAIAAFLIAFLTPVSTMLATAHPIDWRAWVTAVVAGLLAGAAIWVVPNAPKP
jgi:hypothetical protein